MLKIRTNVGKKTFRCHIQLSMAMQGTKIERLLVAILWLAVLLAACVAPAGSGARTPQGAPTETSTAAPPPADSAITEVGFTPETATTTPRVAATSRGPDLEATNPETAALASGGLQLIEFFRFT
jgi:hypothetical protein